MEPVELDVPHWATSMVGNFRRELKLPTEVTDRMIYARLTETSGMDPDLEREMVRSLLAEVRRRGK
jgi:hypothetical protein